MAKGGRGGRRTSLGKSKGLSPNDIVDTTSLVSQRGNMTKEVDSALKVYQDIYNEYGYIINDIHIATLKGQAKTVMGYYDGANIAINKNYFNNTRMESAYKSCVKSGFHPSQGNKTAIQAVTSHEIGHALADKMGVSQRSVIESAMKKTGHGQDALKFASKISGYAKESYEECIAEAFADVYCNGSKASKESRAVVNIMNGYLKK